MNRPLAPKFLKQLDEKLLKNKPELYSTRLLWVAYYGLLTIATLALVFWALPNDPRSHSPVASWVGITIIICLLALVFWLIYLLRFNVFKRFGNITAFGRLSVFASFFACCFIIVFFAYVPPIVETAKANLAYKENELVDDINFINRSICLLERDSLDKAWTIDTFFVTTSPTDFTQNDSLEVRKSYVDEDNEINYYSEYKTPYGLLDDENIISWEGLEEKKIKSDSIVQLKDSLFVFFYCPDYKFVESVSEYRIEDKLDSNKYLFHNFVNSKNSINRESLQIALVPKLKKYSLEDGEEIYGFNLKKVDYVRNDTTYLGRLKRRYITETIENNIQNIANRKYRWDSGMDDMVRVIFYFTFSIAILIFIFRHSTTKTFFVSLLIGILLTILTATIIAFMRVGKESSVLWFIFGYIFLFTVFGALVFQANVRKIVHGIALNLFTLSIYWLPLLLVAIAYESFIYQPAYDSPLRFIYERNKEIAFNIAEFACPILFCILLVTFIHKAYKKWFALAEE